MAHAPVVDPTLAALMAAERDPLEELAADQASTRAIWTMGIARTDVSKHGRVVQLNCGHFTVTKSLQKARCPRCGEMIRAGYDYDAFRHLGASDDFSWPDDPFRLLHESESDPTLQRHSPI